MPIGIATAMLAAEKKLNASSGMPTVNMWCAHTPKLMKPVAIIASTTISWPTSRFCAMVTTIVETIAEAG
ncbi:MAG TPA: hypothetical protein VFZ73_01480, partial [Gemmatimonadaceae bacterium]